MVPYHTIFRAPLLYYIVSAESGAVRVGELRRSGRGMKKKKGTGLLRAIESASSRTTPDEVLHVGEGGRPREAHGNDNERNERKGECTRTKRMGKTGHKDRLPSRARRVGIYIAFRETENLTSDESSKQSVR
jgi:hypothetical protein